MVSLWAVDSCRQHKIKWTYFVNEFLKDKKQEGVTTSMTLMYSQKICIRRLSQFGRGSGLERNMIWQIQIKVMGS